MRCTLITITGLAMVVAACTEATPVEQPNTIAPEVTTTTSELSLSRAIRSRFR